TLVAAASCVLAVLAGCAQIPTQPLVQQPMTALPPPRPVIVQATGAIYTGYSDHPLFEDSRPRNVGDILTIVIAENINATKSSGASANRNGTQTFTPTAIPGLIGGLLSHSTTSITGDNTFQATGGAAAQNTFNGTLTVTVTQVLANGNLMVSGEKQMLINQGNEYVRFSGVVNPTTVTGSNTVASYQVADAKIEYSAKGYINEAETMGWLQRFFLNIAPF
ncbi:MAG TPA: flagellar basal body L-ring protein FlgH, partial [Pararobbsia sp.]|nr:flagellar basal body L-ring protein FlgH [Pararobbsia sp.]